MLLFTATAIAGMVLSMCGQAKANKFEIELYPYSEDYCPAGHQIGDMPVVVKQDRCTGVTPVTHFAPIRSFNFAVLRDLPMEDPAEHGTCTLLMYSDGGCSGEPADTAEELSKAGNIGNCFGKLAISPNTVKLVCYK